MRFYVNIISLAITAAAGNAAPAAPTPTCTPFNYPGALKTTDSTFYLHVKSNNPLLDGRNVQLRSTGDKGAPQIVVVDATSPVLSMRLSNGVIHNENRTIFNQPYDLGPVAHLKNVSTTSTSSKQEFYFQNATSSNKGTKGFMLELLGQNAVYGLYHQTPVNIVNGFIICKEAKGSYYQLYYTTYFSDPDSLPGCEFIGVQVSCE